MHGVSETSNRVDFGVCLLLLFAPTPKPGALDPVVAIWINCPVGSIQSKSPDVKGRVFGSKMCIVTFGQV